MLTGVVPFRQFPRAAAYQLARGLQIHPDRAGGAHCMDLQCGQHAGQPHPQGAQRPLLQLLDLLSR